MKIFSEFKIVSLVFFFCFFFPFPVIAQGEYKLETLECNEDVCQDKQGNLISGTVTDYCKESGRLLSISTYAKGKKNGPARAFWEDGTVKDESLFVDGKKEGVEKSFRDNHLIFSLLAVRWCVVHPACLQVTNLDSHPFLV